jgi:hypothetical protein
MSEGGREGYGEGGRERMRKGEDEEAKGRGGWKGRMNVEW